MTIVNPHYTQAVSKLRGIRARANIMDEKVLSSILLKELEKRKERNPSYSLRSFARDLKLSKTTLSDVVNNKRQLSRQNLRKVAAQLNMPSLLNIPSRPKSKTYHKLQIADEQAMASNWYHYAIFSLAQLKNNSSSPEWISQRLGITAGQAKNARHLLERLKLIDVQGNKMVPLKQNFESSSDIPSAVLRQFHLQNLKRAAESLEKNEISDRDMSSITIAFKEQDMRRAKEYIKAFRHRFCKKYETFTGADVYTLAIQFFPQTVRGDK